jgi:hypothetical protein
MSGNGGAGNAAEACDSGVMPLYIERPEESSPPRTFPAWDRQAERLADFAWRHLVNRTDASGAYYRKGDGFCLYTRKRVLTFDEIVEHFRARDEKGVRGLHSTAPDNSCRWAAWDFDSHDDNNPADNLPGVLSLSDELGGIGFHPLTSESDGKGGFHVRIVFDRPVDASLLHPFAKALAGRHNVPGGRCDVFPRQAHVGAFGNWLRLYGRHYKRDFWTTFYDGRKFVGCDGATEFLLAQKPDSADLLVAQAGLCGDSLGIGTGSTEIQIQIRQWHGYETSQVGNSDTLTGDDVVEIFKSLFGLTCRRRGWMFNPDLEALADRHRPARRGERERSLFSYARALRGPFAGLEPHQLRVAFRRWWERAYPVVGTRSERGAFVAFLRAFYHVKSPPTRLDVARLDKSSADVVLPDGADTLPENARRLLRHCVALQGVNGSGRFYMTYDDAARLLGMSKPGAQYVMMRLMKTGLIERLETGNDYKRKASVYRVVAGDGT